MVDVFLIIVCIVFSALALFAGFYIVNSFQHPEDKHTSWFAKIIVILALGVATMNVLMLPLDALNRKGTLKIDIMCWIFTIVSLVLAFIIIPFATNYYENKDDESVKHPLCKAFLVPIPFLLFVVIMFLILWFAVGRCEVPIVAYAGQVYDTADQGEGACDNCQTTWNITPSALTYVVSIIGFLGYLLLITLGGIGVATLPIGLISKFINRPRPISMTIYAKAKNAVNRWSNELLEEGNILREDVLQYGRNHKKVRKRLAKFEQQVFALEEAYKTIETSFKLRGGNPIMPWLDLLMGIIGIIVSIVWIVHICIYYIADFYPFLNAFFDILDRGFPYAAVIFYGIFIYYIFWCCLDGTCSVGINLLFFRIHPMERDNTPMTSLLFNCGVMLFSSFGCALFGTMMFNIFQRLSSLDLLYGAQIQYLAGLKYVWQYGIYVFLGFFVIAFVVKIITCKKKDTRVDDLKRLLNENYDVAAINAAKKK